MIVPIACCILLLITGISSGHVWLSTLAVLGIIACGGILLNRRPPS